MAARSPFDPLKDAARYVRAFRDKPFVVKLGGHILADAALRESVCGQLALLHGFAIPLVVVHGGAPSVDLLCERLGLATTKIGGRRITSPEVLEASKMALKGTLQMDLLGSMHAAGLHAVGLSGQDAWMLHAHRRPPVNIDGQMVDYGCVRHRSRRCKTAAPSDCRRICAGDRALYRGCQPKYLEHKRRHGGSLDCRRARCGKALLCSEGARFALRS